MAAYPGPFPHGLMFHRFHRQGEAAAGQGSVSDTVFEAMLRAIGPQRLLAPQEWMGRAQAGLLQPSDLCITLDDGLKSQMETALPVLDRLGLKAFWFVYSAALHGHYDRNEIANYLAMRHFMSFAAYADQFMTLAAVPKQAFESDAWYGYSQDLETRFPFYSAQDIRYRYVRNHWLSQHDFEGIVDDLLQSRGLNLQEVASQLWMTPNDVKSLHAAGHTIGMHSYSHPFALADLRLADQRAEYRRNFDDLTHLTGEEPRSMSHPLNSHSQETLAILAELRIECGFCSNMQPPQGCAFVNPSQLQFAREDSAALLALVPGLD